MLFSTSSLVRHALSLTSLSMLFMEQYMSWTETLIGAFVASSRLIVSHSLISFSLTYTEASGTKWFSTIEEGVSTILGFFGVSVKRFIISFRFRTRTVGEIAFFAGASHFSCFSGALLAALTELNPLGIFGAISVPKSKSVKIIVIHLKCIFFKKSSYQINARLA